MEPEPPEAPPENRPARGGGARAASLFVLGLFIGALSLYYILWRTGGLTAGHPLSRTTHDWRQPSAGSSPLPTIPLPSPTATPSTTAPPTPAAIVSTPSLEDFAQLKGRVLGFPIDEYRLVELKDTFEETRGGSRRHEAMDVLAPRGTPVLAVDEGKVVKLFKSDQGGLTVYQFDPLERYAYYYAHLDRYASGLKEGDVLRKGDRVGYVGTTGNAAPETPHLHFAVFRLGPEKRWWEGTPINPYPLFVGPIELGR